VITANEFPVYQRACGQTLSVISNSQRIITYSIAIKKYSFLSENFREIVDKLFQTGIAQYLMEQHTINFYGTIAKMDENVSKALKLNDLKFVFILWLALIGVSIILFCFEYLATRIKETSLDILRNCYVNWLDRET